MMRAGVTPGLHHPVMTPRPAAAQIELLGAARGGVRVVKVRGSEDDSQFAQQVLEERVAVCESGEFNTVPVDVEHCCLFSGDDELPKIAQFRGIAPEEQNQPARIRQRIRINDHRGAL